MARAKKNTADSNSSKGVGIDEVNSYDQEVSKRIDGVADLSEKEDNETQENEKAATKGTDNDSDVETNTEADEGDEVSEDVLSMLAHYAAAYPDNNIFHITSDGQVFLEKNKSDAIRHEKTLGGKVKSYEV